MSAKIIDSHRYKKTTRKKANESKEAKKTSLKYKKAKLKKIKEDKKVRLDNLENEHFVNEKNKKNNKKIYKSKMYFPKLLKIFLLVLCIGIIGVISKIIVKNEERVVVPADNNKEEVVSLVSNYDFNIGISKLDTIDYMKSQNIILNELYLKSNNVLVSIDKEYNINYVVAKNIEKINAKEYFIELNDKYDITSKDIESSINAIKEAGSSNIYFSRLDNIEKIYIQDDNSFKIKLKEDDNYFVYALEFPIVSNTKEAPFVVEGKTDNSLTLKRNTSDSTLNKITFTGYGDSDYLIEDFKNGKLDMFTASSDSIMQLIGKYDYNVKRYRDGECIFLLGNKDSKLFSKKEVRQALLYSLNREEILKEVNNKFYELIDIPYIYSSVKYKYDIYGAQNALQSQGWVKSSGTYKKNVDGEELVLEVKLLVNEDNSLESKIADKIKESLEQNGIKVYADKKKGEDFNTALNNKDYDVVLAYLYLNQNPDINFINEYLNINETVNSAINIVNSSNTVDLSKNISNLQNILSSEVACIGLVARTTNVVYQKNINGFNDLGYMEVFNDFKNIGKIQDVENE